MVRTRSTSRSRRRENVSIRLEPNGWHPKFWLISFSVLGQAVASIPLYPGLAYAAATAAAGIGAAMVGIGAVVGAGYAVFTVSEALWTWATSSNEETPVSSQVVHDARIEAQLAPTSKHVAVCGPSGSGKTSVVNALRGLANHNPDAARVGTVETTTETTRYPAHSSFQSLSLFDVPGAGTLRVPSDGYYNKQKLFIFDMLLVVWGERLGETEINIIKSCILNRQQFVLVRSRSDEIINRILDDYGEEDSETSRQLARETAISNTAESLGDEFKRAGIPGEALEELLGFCVLVNKNDLRKLSLTDDAEGWPDPRGRPTEVHERLLLEMLGKRKLAASPPVSDSEGNDVREGLKTAGD